MEGTSVPTFGILLLGLCVHILLGGVWALISGRGSETCKSQGFTQSVLRPLSQMQQQFSHDLVEAIPIYALTGA